MIDTIKHRGCIVSFAAVYDPVQHIMDGGRKQYFIGIDKADNPELGEMITWRYRTDRRTGEPKYTATFKSNRAPIVTMGNGDGYDDLLRYRRICEARNISPDLVFRGATVDIVVDESNTLLEIIFHRLIDPREWEWNT